MSVSYVHNGCPLLTNWFSLACTGCLGCPVLTILFKNIIVIVLFIVNSFHKHLRALAEEIASVSRRVFFSDKVS